jgi:hypothetical protein
MRMAFALITSLAALGLSTPSTAQVISVSQVLAECPDLSLGEACPTVATGFLQGRRPGTRLNGQVVDLVVAIAEAAQQDGIPRKVCLNAADGLRVLATGVTNEDQANQINDIADALCLRNRTAAIRGPGGLFDTVSSGGAGGAGDGNPGGGAGGGGGGGGGGDPGGGGGGGGGDPGGSGGLGSNDAGHGNANALAHANEHATENTHGKNGQND